jgi:hypothetical protein
MGEYFLILFGIALIIVGPTAYNNSNKRTYFKKQLDIIDDEDQKRTIQWYIKYLDFQVRNLIVLTAIIILPGNSAPGKR